MFLYILIFVLAVAMMYSTLSSEKKYQAMVSTWYLAGLGLFVALSDMFGGYDRYIYAELFDRMADVTRVGDNPWTSESFEYYDTEFGYGTWCALLSYITYNRYIFIFVTTITAYFLLIRSFKDYSDNVPFTIILFLGLWFFFTFTYLRQVMGCAVGALSYRYVIKRDFKRFIIIWFIAYSFHNSALLLLPIYFLPPIRKFKIETVIQFMVICFLIGLTPIPQGLFSTYDAIDDARVAAGGYNQASGFRIAYLLEAGFFLYFILKNYKKIPETPKDIIFLNMSLIFCAILLVFVKSENGGRMSWYFMVPLVCFLPKVCLERRKINSYGLIIIVTCFFLYYRIYNSWQTTMHALYPYKTFLTDGHRQGDNIYDEFEYDTNYDEDKFYRPALWFMK